MLTTTIPRLRCPAHPEDSDSRCGSPLALAESPAPRFADAGTAAQAAIPAGAREIRFGRLACPGCGKAYPILEGVAILVEDLSGYFRGHAKGLMRLVPEPEIPAELLVDFVEGKEEIETEHIEWDLESERVVALYILNHYLRAGAPGTGPMAEWWKPEAGAASPLIDALVREHWDRGPFSVVSRWVGELRAERGESGAGAAIELGCGVGGLLRVLRPVARSYLGVDTSFASVAVARHLALGFPIRGGELHGPGDLLLGTSPRPLPVEAARGEPALPEGADFVVGEIESVPVEAGAWGLTVAMNAIDMLPDPGLLPALQYQLLKEGGVAVQSCPYIWHEEVAQAMREVIPDGIRDSARAVEWLYEESGLAIEDRVEHSPWLFFKHPRQLEIYSVHLFRATRR